MSDIDRKVGRVLNRFVELGGTIYSISIPPLKRQFGGPPKGSQKERDLIWVASVAKLIERTLLPREQRLLSAFYFSPQLSAEALAQAYDTEMTPEEARAFRRGLELGMKETHNSGVIAGINMSPRGINSEARWTPKDREWFGRKLHHIRRKLYWAMVSGGLIRPVEKDDGS